MQLLKKAKFVFLFLCLISLIVGLFPTNTDLLQRGYRMVSAQEVADPGSYTLYDDEESYSSVTDPVSYTLYDEPAPTTVQEPTSYTLYDERTYDDPGATVVNDPTGYTLYDESSYGTTVADPSGYTLYDESSYDTTVADPTSYTLYDDPVTTVADPTGYTLYDEPVTTVADPTGYTLYPNPAPEPVTSYVDFECQGVSQVYYRFYSDGRREATGRVIASSSSCGYYPAERSSGSTNTSTPRAEVYETRRYPECSNSGPGMVRDVIAYSDGTYKTYNEHFQAGACGTWEGAGCFGNHSVWGVWDGSKLIRSERDYGVVVGECNNVSPSERTVSVTTGGGSGSSSSNSSSSSSSNSSSSSQGGNANVTVNVSGGTTQTNPERFPTLSTTCAVSPINPRVGEEVSWRAIPTGGSGDFSFRWVGGDAPLVGKTENPATVVYSSDGYKAGEVRVFDRQTRQDVYATCRVEVAAKSSTPTPTPTPSVTSTSTPTPTPTSYPTHIVTVNQPKCPEGTSEQRRTAVEIICERRAAITTTTISDTGSGSTSGVQQIVLTGGTAPAVTPTVTVVGQDQVAGIKELPKTGLPLAGVALGSLTPLGLRMRRMGKKTTTLSAASIWSERQFKL